MHRLAATLLDDRSLLAETSDASSGPSDGETDAVLAMISISAVMPRDPAALTVQKIKEIRESSPFELGRFRSFLSTRFRRGCHNWVKPPIPPRSPLILPSRTSRTSDHS